MVGSITISPEEIRRRKIIKKGIDFTILICGQEGSGKKAFINSLCRQEVLKNDTDHVDPKESHLNPGIQIYRNHVNVVDEDSTPISLDIVLAPGFGDNIDNRTCTQKVVDYLEAQFDDFLNEECSIKRDPRFKDGRPHATLYFIRPTSKGLRELDVEVMKQLSSRVNVIPVISKADSLTHEELKLNKALILQDIKANNIPIYDFPVENDDSDSIDDVKALRSKIPFSISGSYDTEVIDNITYHVRRYPWGVLQVESPEHSDFTALRNALFGSHLQELKETTHSVLYERFRRAKLLDNEGYPKVSSREDNTNLLDSYNYQKKEGGGAQDDETYKELLRKKKLIENYTSDVRKLEYRLRVSSFPSANSTTFIADTSATS